MPLYEYQCESDGTVIELIRPMAQADDPVPDPDGKGRKFLRKMSTFAPKGAAASLPIGAAGGGCCPCGKSGGCGSGPG